MRTRGFAPATLKTYSDFFNRADLWHALDFYSDPKMFCVNVKKCSFFIFHESEKKKRNQFRDIGDLFKVD